MSVQANHRSEIVNGESTIDLKSIKGSQWSSIGSCRPAHLSPSTGAGKLGGCNFLFEEVVEGLGDGFRRAALDDVPVWQAVTKNARKALWAREAHVVRQPDGFLGQNLGKFQCAMKPGSAVLPCTP